MVTAEHDMSIKAISSDTMPEVSVVIVNYFSDDYTLDAIQSLESQQTDVSYEILVVDNGADTAFPGRLSECSAPVRRLGDGTNLGFGGACNLAIAASKAGYIMLLNPDTRVLSDIITAFLSYCEGRDDVGCVGPYLLDEDGQDTHSYAGLDNYRRDILYEFFYAWKKLFYLKKARLRPAPPTVRRPEREVGYITGACLFFRRDVFRQLGGFDERFFVYSEETDLQWRMRARGLKRVIIDGPKVIHLAGKTFKTSNSRRIMMTVSKMRFIRKHYSALRYWLFKVVFIEAALVGLVADFYYGQYSLAENRRYLKCLVFDRYV
jgi:GT2 family glycosyltransferase